jgi:hypothetical protein
MPFRVQGPRFSVRINVAKYKSFVLTQSRDATSRHRLCRCRRFLDILDWHVHPTLLVGFFSLTKKS